MSYELSQEIQPATNITIRIGDPYKQNERWPTLRRVALLCCHFVRNYAYYKAGWTNNVTKAHDDFWLTIQGNFIDIATLEWMKLFGSVKDKHNWQKIIIENPDQFKEKMLASCKLTDEEFCKLHRDIKAYRDRFIAHLDSDEVMHIPYLGNTLKLTYFYYNAVFQKLPEDKRAGLPLDINLYYNNCFTTSEIYFNQLEISKSKL